MYILYYSQVYTVRVVEQLRACGVLETVPISAAGATHHVNSNYFDQYQILSFPRDSCMCCDDHAHV